LTTQALCPHRRLGGSTTEAAGTEHVMPGPPLLGVCDSICDHDMGEAVLHQVQKAFLLRDLRFGSISDNLELMVRILLSDISFA
jgi:hypothetical protein